MKLKSRMDQWYFCQKCVKRYFDARFIKTQKTAGYFNYNKINNFMNPIDFII